MSLNPIDAQMTKGAWTSRAYDRTKRKALKEGKSKEAAAELARQAFKAAVDAWQQMLDGARDLD